MDEIYKETFQIAKVQYATENELNVEQIEDQVEKDLHEEASKFANQVSLDCNRSTHRT